MVDAMSVLDENETCSPSTGLVALSASECFYAPVAA
jgi:hypothetical protein